MARQQPHAGTFAIGVVATMILSFPALGASKTERALIAEADAFVKSKPLELQPFLHSLYMEGEWNAVLNLDLLALAAMDLGAFDVAARALDQATVRIERIYSDDPNAAKARSVWSAEEVKDFKGEPYERAMTYFYRGLLYLREGDPQNARAAFLQSDLQNAMGETEAYERSFFLASYLAAWSSVCAGDATRAHDLLAQRDWSKSPDPFFSGGIGSMPQHLVLIERGVGPEKVTYGDTKSILGFLPQPDVNQQFQVVYDDPRASADNVGVAARIDWLALTRGERPIQGILNGKAVFKERTASVADLGNSVAQAALYTSLNSLGSSKPEVSRSLGALGLGASVLSAAMGIVSRAANAEADTRYWGSLPKYLELHGFPHGPPPKIARISESAMRPPGRTTTAQFPVSGACSFTHIREFSSFTAIDGGTGNPSPWPARPLERRRVEANHAFRSMLRSTF